MVSLMSVAPPCCIPVVGRRRTGVTTAFPTSQAQTPPARQHPRSSTNLDPTSLERPGSASDAQGELLEERGRSVSTDPISAVEPTRVTVVESEACHFCRDAHRDLEELATCYRLTVDTLSVRSAAGQDLVARHCAAPSPLVLLARVPGALVHGGRGDVPPLATAAAHVRLRRRARPGCWCRSRSG